MANLETKVNNQKHAGITWLDVHSPDEETFARLKRDYHLHPLHLNESVQKVQHTQVEREDDYLFLVLHFPVLDPHEDKIVVGQLGVFLGKDYLVTISTVDCPVVAKLFELCADHQAQGEAYFRKGPDYLLYVLVNRLLNNISDMNEEVLSELDEIEDLVFDNDDSDAQKIGRLRQKIVRLRRIIGPKRLLLEDLAQHIRSFDKDMYRYYSNNTKMVNKLWEVIEEAKETVEIYKDADFTTSTEKTNKILMLLTLVFTFTIPVTILGTLYGMNVPLPGGIQTGVWTFLGAYTTPLLLVAVSLLLALAMYVFFKKRKWF